MLQINHNNIPYSHSTKIITNEIERQVKHFKKIKNEQSFPKAI